jgi:hypothetical protein
MKKVLTSLVTFALTVGACFAVEFRPLSINERSGVAPATHQITYTYADFAAVTATNTALTSSNAVPANTLVRAVGMKLNTAFDTANTNYTGSVALTVGDGSTANLFLASTELASDGSEVYFKFAPLASAAVSQTIATTNLIYASAADTNGAVTAFKTNVVVASASAATSAITVLGEKFYSAAGNIVFTFTPTDTPEALDDNSSGSVTVYFQLIQ